MTEEKKTFTLKKSDVRKSEVLAPLWIWRCPICYKEVMSYSIDRVIAGAKLHLERSHKYEVKVTEE